MIKMYRLQIYQRIATAEAFEGISSYLCSQYNRLKTTKSLIEKSKGAIKWSLKRLTLCLENE